MVADISAYDKIPRFLFYTKWTSSSLYLYSKMSFLSYMKMIS